MNNYQPPLGGLVARRSREVPHHMDRTLERLPHEDHMEFCFALRQQCAWYNDKEFEKLSVESCSDPRMHIKEREQAANLTNDAAERRKQNFENLHETIDDYLRHYGCIPYCVILQMLAHEIFGSWLT